MDREQLKSEIRKTICRVTELSEDQIEGDETLIDDLGIESVMLVDILAEVEEKYQVEIPEERYEELDCLDSFVDLVQELIPGA